MNAKQELLSKLDETFLSIKCAAIDIEISYGVMKQIRLPLNYSPEQYEEFLSALDVEYSSGYGSQELFGRVWLTQDVWLERHEYDGSEWWTVKKLPPIHKELFNKDIVICHITDPSEEDDQYIMHHFYFPRIDRCNHTERLLIKAVIYVVIE